MDDTCALGIYLRFPDQQTVAGFLTRFRLQSDKSPFTFELLPLEHDLQNSPLFDQLWDKMWDQLECPDPSSQFNTLPTALHTLKDGP